VVDIERKGTMLRSGEVAEMLEVNRHTSSGSRRARSMQ